MNRRELKNILQSAYDRDLWISTLQFLTGKRDFLTVQLSPREIEIHTQEANRIVKNFYQIASVKTSDGVSLPIFEIVLEDYIRIEHNRVGVNEFIKKYIIKDAVRGALVTFSYENNHEKTEWRFSFISKNSASDFFSEAEEQETNPKKYTYIFGNEEEHRTAIERLYNLEQSRFRLDDFFEAFNVEPVSKKFFEEYKHLYREFSDFIIETSEYYQLFVNAKDETEKPEKEIRNFVGRLLGRIVFLYFLQKKNWLGASDENYKDGSTTFLSDLFLNDVENQNDFYQKYLCPIFFNALNIADRDNSGFELENGETVCIPFLNGGLFEEEQEPKNHRIIKFPGHRFKMLFDFFNGFNFTVYENSPEEHVVAVDPEMLGRIFENLIDYNKDTGTFYTPKEIVQYMTQESLVEYLNTHLQKDRSAIENMVKNQTTVGFEDSALEKINELLNAVKICDPAIGSGAFPMGMLQEIFNLKALIAYQLKSHFDPAETKQNIIQNSIYGVDLDEGAVEIARLRFWLSLVVDEGMPKALPNLDYKIMQGNSLLESFRGIDLSNLKNVNTQSIPEQARINFGEEHALGITFFDDLSFETLQELVKKYFIAGNKGDLTKTEIKKQINDFIESKIHFKIKSEKDNYKTLIHQFYKKYNLTKDSDLQGFNLKSKELKNLFTNKKKFEELESIEIELISFQTKKERPYFLWHLFFADVLDNDGFDIVIGNPPYIKEYANKKAFDGFRNSPYYKGKMDIWYGFASFGLDLLKENGTECFIAQNNWVTSAGASILRNDVLQRTEIKQFIDFGDYKVFQSAGIQTMIYLLQKKQMPAENYLVYFAGLSEANINKSQLDSFLNHTQNISKENYFEKHWQEFIPEKYVNNYISFVKGTVKTILNVILNKSNFSLNKKNVAQGIVAPQDKLNRKAVSILGDNFNLNQGVFVLSNSEKESCHFNEKEEEFLKPYYTTDNLKKFVSISDNSEWVLYTKSDLNSKIASYPNIKKHLDQFEKIITSDFKPYGLHRARDDYFFEGEKIISLRKCSEPTFTFTDFECYVSQTFFIIKDPRINQKYLTAFLNSKIVYYWLKNEGKMQGSNFQIDKEPLLKIPIYKPENYSPFLELFELVTFTIQAKENIIPGVENKHIVDFFQEVIDACFFEIYFPEEMKNKNILVFEQVKKSLEIVIEFSKFNESQKINIVKDLYLVISHPDSDIRNKIKSFSLLSPNLLAIILNS